MNTPTERSVVRTEATFLAEYDGVPDDVEVLPGFTVGQGRAMLRRPAEDPPGTTFIPSITYSYTTGDTGQMAIYARANCTERAPIVVAVHGGGWSSGHHFGEIRYLYPLAARGYVVATLTYRFAQEAPWPAAIEDTKCAVRWLRHHAEDLGGDPDRIVVYGGSAGGHLAALVALTPGDYEGDGGCDDVSSEVQGAFLLSPAADLESVMSSGVVPEIADYFGDDLADASPLNRVHEGCPPIRTVTGSADMVTPVTGIARFHDALEAAGVPQRLEIYEGGIHGFDLSDDGFRWCQTQLAEFVTEVVGEPDEV